MKIDIRDKDGRECLKDVVRMLRHMRMTDMWLVSHMITGNNISSNEWYVDDATKYGAFIWETLK